MLVSLTFKYSMQRYSRWTCFNVYVLYLNNQQSISKKLKTSETVLVEYHFEILNIRIYLIKFTLTTPDLALYQRPHFSVGKLCPWLSVRVPNSFLSFVSLQFSILNFSLHPHPPKDTTKIVLFKVMLNLSLHFK